VRVDWNLRRLGPAVSRNRALARSSGELLQNLDADDQLLPGALSALETALRADPAAAFAFGEAVDLHGDGRLARFPPTFPAGPVPPGEIPARWRSDPADYWVPIHPAGIMWRRQVVLELGGWPALWGVDDTALLMSAAAVHPSVSLGRETFLYRRHERQISGTRAHRQQRAEQVEFIRQRVAALSAAAAQSVS
jgi:glycosyltransferase involved in cell wall biosynthesis